MKSDFATIAIVTVSVALNLLLLWPLTGQNADFSYTLGRLFGATAAAFLIGAFAAWIWGKFRDPSNDAFWRRTNWIALVTILLSAAGRLGSVQ
jgi:membrane-anchored protein YejM (alkaline phosphatase superfamily)